MSRLRIVLISLAGAAVVFGGGWFLGALVGDAEPVAIADDDAGVQIPLAVPLGYGEDLPDAEGFDDLLEPASVRLPVDLVEPVPLADDDTPPPLGAFRIAGTDVEPVELVDDGPRPPFEPLTTPLGEPDADGDIDPAGWETTGDAEEVELEELLGPPPEEFEGDSSDPAGGDDAGASVLFHYGFFDWCAEADADDGAENGDSAGPGGFCPFGIGGTILPIDDGGSLPPFEIGAVYWDDVFFTDACHPLGWRDGDTSTYHLLLRANAPGEFRVNYRHQAVPSFGIPAQIVASTTQEQEDEWIARSAAGERFNDVEICLPVAIPEQWPPGYLTLEIRGTDINGRIAERRLGAALAIRDDQRTVRPPMQLDTTYSNRRMSDAFLSVPFDPEREQAWLAVIPRDGPRAMTESCTDIERAARSQPSARPGGVGAVHGPHAPARRELGSGGDPRRRRPHHPGAGYHL